MDTPAPRRQAFIGCSVMTEEATHLAARCRHHTTLSFIEMGLHDTPKLLHTAIQEAVDRVDESHEVILLGYGLCSKGLAEIRAGSIPLVIPRAHDCVTLFLGSAERYRRHFAQRPDTYWYMPGSVDGGEVRGPDRHARLIRDYTEKYGEKKAKRLAELDRQSVAHYKRAAFVELGMTDSTEARQKTKDAARWQGWEYDEITGDKRLLTDLLEGPWDEGRFLVVKPGQIIVPVYDDETILAARDPEA
ncbi:DUF1638 domain-containing protein [Desulfoluna spongiiphila]|uniref:DUF1638 domain-containing protein n=1 Tax=Desulfoluna spongiiphila TaxID=419481 RepID=A0A1G5ATY1_9BACT|nr:DUF1638 domain-containing protein [Desulfoluna spongiiphila]SCX81299.1 Protein of unknown function [Desulfoluna spongiiphila]